MASSSVNRQITSSNRVVISSRYGSGTPSNFKVNLVNNDMAHGKIVRILPVDIFIPNLFNNVTESNRFISFEDLNASITYDIDMPLGFYTVDQYVAELTAQIASITGMTAGTIILEGHFIDTVTGKLSLQFNDDVQWASVGGSDNLVGEKDGTSFPAGVLTEFPNNMNFAGPCAVIVGTTVMSSNAALAGTQSRNLAFFDIVSLAETCHGECAHQFVRTENVRASSLGNDVSFNDIEVRLVDINNNEMVLPENCEVLINFLISYGEDH